MFKRILEIFAFFVAFLYLANTECPFPSPNLLNGHFIYENEKDSNLTMAPENYILRFACEVGYVITEPKVISCISGEWSGKVPRCLMLYCQMPPSISYGNYVLNKGSHQKLVVGTTANYYCLNGYELENKTNSIIICHLNIRSNTVSWKGDMPKCKRKRSCPHPGTSPDGKMTGHCCFEGDAVTFSCNYGYELIGEETIFCLPGGSWNSPRPLCRPVDDYCEDPPSIPNGIIKHSKFGDYYLPYDEVEVVCDPGYVYEGTSEFIMCLEDMSWEEEFAGCQEVFCGMPKIPENGSILELNSTNATEFSFNFDITYVCDPGFRLIGISWRVCEKGVWSGQDPYCEVIKCPDPGVPENGRRIGNNFNIGDRVLFKCSSGFNLIGSLERYCLPNGQWSGELTRCDNQRNYCPDPGIPINGMKNSSSYEMGNKIGFKCQPGFSLIGSVVRECLPDRSWSGIEAQCLGRYDFDSSAKVSEILKEDLQEKATQQRKELSKLRNALIGLSQNGSVALQRQRILDLSYAGRYILYFIFDVSGSVKLRNFKKSINFAKAIVQKVGISENGARAGALTFSSNANIQFLPVEYTTTKQVLDALDAIEYTGGGTATNSALKLVREEIIPLTHNVFNKKGIKSVIFILTDGKANTGGDPEFQADKLKKAGVEIYCIGITGSPEKESLYKIASEPKDDHKYVFILNNYATLDWLVKKITNETIDYSQCGLGMEKVKKRVQRARISGGAIATDPWPWMAALFILDEDSTNLADAELKCGGSIIHKRFILTAAHCLFIKSNNQERRPNDVIIKLGLKDLKNQTNIQEFEISRFIIHDKFVPGTNYDYDIALIQLKRPIEFNQLIRPICLPPTSLPENTTLYKPKEYAFAIGWGHTGRIGRNEIKITKIAENLKELQLPLQPRNQCLQSILDNGGTADMLTPRMFCAGTGLDGNDTCSGDSGGPLMQSQLSSEGNVFWTQVGIVSWGIGCALLNTYGYYTHVHDLISWVHQKINSTEI